MKIVTTEEEISQNIRTFASYRLSMNESAKQYFGERLRLGKVFVVGVSDEVMYFCPSRFAGYSNCTLEKHLAFPNKDGKLTTPAITKVLGQHTEDIEAEAAYQALCHEIGVLPSDRDRSYWRINTFESD